MMRTVKQINEELYWAKDNGLTPEQIENLEMELWEVETIECNPQAQAPTQNTHLTYEEVYKELAHTIPHRSRNSQKAVYARKWVSELQTNDQRFAIDNFSTIYRRNTETTFRIGLVK